MINIKKIISSLVGLQFIFVFMGSIPLLFLAYFNLQFLKKYFFHAVSLIVIFLYFIDFNVNYKKKHSPSYFLSILGILALSIHSALYNDIDSILISILTIFYPILLIIFTSRNLVGEKLIEAISFLFTAVNLPIVVMQIYLGPLNYREMLGCVFNEDDLLISGYKIDYFSDTIIRPMGICHSAPELAGLNLAIVAYFLLSKRFQSSGMNQICFVLSFILIILSTTRTEIIGALILFISSLRMFNVKALVLTSISTAILILCLSSLWSITSTESMQLRVGEIWPSLINYVDYRIIFLGLGFGVTGSSAVRGSIFAYFDNGYLFLIASSGIIGLLLYAWILYRAVNWRIYVMLLTMNVVSDIVSFYPFMFSLMITQKSISCDSKESCHGVRKNISS